MSLVCLSHLLSHIWVDIIFSMAKRNDFEGCEDSTFLESSATKEGLPVTALYQIWILIVRREENAVNGGSQASRHRTWALGMELKGEVEPAGQREVGADIP